MNDFEERFDTESSETEVVDRAELDRLVDGELTDDEQRSLLKRLEETPAGWKQLALAYVEAATWRTHFATHGAASRGPAFGSATSIGVMPGSENQTVLPVPQDSLRTRRESASTIALAAFAVLVFGLGIWLGRTEDQLFDDPHYVAEEVESPESGMPDEMAPDESRPSDAADTTRDVAAVPETVQVVFSDGQSDLLRVLDVPMSDTPQRASQLDEFWHNRKSAIPADVRAMLEKSGHRISESHNFWPTQLPDGRSVVIPVSQIQVAESSQFSP